MLAAPAYAQSPPPAAAVSVAGPPEVLVLVYQQPGGQDQVNITYAHLVPHAQASADIDSLTQLSGWPISSRRIKDASAPLQNRTGAMTSVTFQVPGVVQDSAHTFPVEVLARAFQKYKRLNASAVGGPTHRPAWSVLLGIIGLAALAGLAAYFVAARLTPGQQSKPKFEETDAEADGRLEAGARK